jgi:drug/metabolite transporter (DMT)-like permease
MTLRDYAMLFVLGAIWGASFLFIRVASPVFGPTALVEYRVLLAGITLLIYGRLTGHRIALRQHWREFLILGALNAAIPFTLIAFGALSLPASMSSLLNTALLSVVFLSDRLTPRRIIGLVLGMVGVALVVGWSPLDLTPAIILACVATLGGALFYGLGSVYSRHIFKGMPALTMAAGQQLGAAVLLAPLTLVNLPQTMTAEAFIPATVLALLCTAFAYLLYFALIRSVGPTNTSTVTLIVPVFGILWGVTILGETLTLGMVLGFGVILASLILVTSVTLRKADASAEALADAPLKVKPGA